MTKFQGAAWNIFCEGIPEWFTQKYVEHYTHTYGDAFVTGEGYSLVIKGYAHMVVSYDIMGYRCEKQGRQVINSWLKIQL